jgi:hypothetical protein
MALRLFISDYTHRTAEQQTRTLLENLKADGAPIFTQADLPNLFRPTQRKTQDTYFAASVACFARDEESFNDLIAACRKRKARLGSIEEGFSWHPSQSTSGAAKAWKEARINGASKVGAMLSARRREADSKIACDKIKDRWPLPSGEWRTPVLLKEVDISYNTAIKFLGKRPISQYNYQAKLKRKARKNADL